ncbi:MAG: MBL fold metallo-hydrolase [Dehalococcoidia bacterium]|nr:MBL fold metallo-hydrolase [Dehalococcoidia bacterium]
MVYVRPLHLSSPVAGEAPATSLRWLGHSTFLLTTASGTRILMDPIPESYGYNGLQLDGVEAVTITHEHLDHVNVGMAAGNPLVLRGLSGGDWARIDRKVKDVTVRSVGSYHDDSRGSRLGKNAIFVFEADDMRIVHLGDLGQVLSQDQVSTLKPVDILLIPVGGFYTIDAARATQVVEQLTPRVVIPMHYKTPKLRPDWPGVGVEDFLAGKKVQRAGSSTYVISKDTLPGETTTVVLSSE